MIFVPENELEQALVRVRSDPTALPDFYRLLMDSPLLVLGRLEGYEPSEEVVSPQPGTGFELAMLEKGANFYYAVFSAMSRFKTFGRAQRSYFCVSGANLFQRVRGVAFVINPDSEGERVLPAAEIARWVDPSAPAPQSPVIIGQPEIYPRKLVEALCVLFLSRSQVARAYLVQIAVPGSGQPSHPLIGIEVRGGADKLVSEMRQVVALAAPGKLVDMTLISPQNDASPVQAGLLKSKPFYIRPVSATLN